MKKFITLLALVCGTALGATTDQDQYLKNLLLNSGFESGKSSWTASGGTFAITSTAAHLGSGKFSGSWDASGVQTLSSSQRTVPAGLFGQNCMGEISYKGADSNLNLEAYDGSNVLATVALATQATYAKARVSFICPSSGTVGLRISAGADAAILYLDDAFLGRSTMTADVSQAEFVGSSYYAATAGCTFTNSSVSFAALTDSDCPGPTVISQKIGTWQTTDTNNIDQTINSLPPGIYRVVFQGSVYVGSSGVVGQVAITDGTTTSKPSLGTQDNAYVVPVTAEGFFEYTSGGNRTFSLVGRAASGSINVYNLNSTETMSTWTIFKYPSSTSTVVRNDDSPLAWAGYHGNDCSWTSTSAQPTFADPSDDGSCTFTERLNQNFGSVTSYGSKKPGLVFTPKRAGVYNVCAVVMGYNQTTAKGGYFELSDETPTIISTVMTVPDTGGNQKNVTMCGLLNIASIAQKTVRIRMATDSGGTAQITGYGGTQSVEWSIYPISISFPQPVVINSVTTSSAGQERVERVKVTSICSSSPCTITSQSNWLSSITRDSLGHYTLNIKAGVFSEAPSCSGQSEGSAVTFIQWYPFYGSNTKTSVQFQTPKYDVSVFLDSAFDIFCQGPK